MENDKKNKFNQQDQQQQGQDQDQSQQGDQAYDADQESTNQPTAGVDLYDDDGDMPTDTDKANAWGGDSEDTDEAA